MYSGYNPKYVATALFLVLSIYIYCYTYNTYRCIRVKSEPLIYRTEPRDR